MASTSVSAGLLMYRRSAGGLEVLLVHPGGPFWANKHAGAWTIPKGLVEPREDPLDAAKREFREETGLEPPAAPGAYLPLGSIRQKAGKTVHAWAFEGQADAAAVRSNSMRLQWPPRSGKWIQVPEVDEARWATPAAARDLINPAQEALIDRLEAALRDPPSG